MVTLALFLLLGKILHQLRFSRAFHGTFVLCSLNAFLAFILVLTELIEGLIHQLHVVLLVLVLVRFPHAKPVLFRRHWELN